MKTIKLFGNVLAIAALGIPSLMLKDTFPFAGGVLGAVAVLFAFGVFVVYRYGYRSIDSIFPKPVVLKLGIWPAALCAVFAFLLISNRASASFLLSFLGTIAFVASFMFASLAVIARNP